MKNGIYAENLTALPLMRGIDARVTVREAELLRTVALLFNHPLPPTSSADPELHRKLAAPEPGISSDRVNSRAYAYVHHPTITTMPENNTPRVGILMGSDSDWPVMEKALKILNEFGVPAEVRVLSAHRTPTDAAEYAETAVARGLEVIIAGAGMAAHLAGVLAAFTPLPIIGVPIPSPNLQGLDSLLAIVQMPSGVPVATVAIGGSKNAALLAIQILGTADADLRQKMIDYKANMVSAVAAKDANVQAMAAALQG